MKIGVPLESCWKDITADEKEKAGKDRADAHNKCIKYKESYEENIRVLNELVSECNERGVRVWIVVMPMSESYKKYLNPEFEKQFYEALNRIDGEIHLIDFNVIDHNFSDEDFNDMDHLSEKGAIKVTEIINQTAYPK